MATNIKRRDGEEAFEAQIDEVSKKLAKKYSRQSNLNIEAMRKHARPIVKVFSVIYTVFTAIVALISIIVCISTAVNSAIKAPNCMLGRCVLVVSSGSMSAPDITIDGEKYDSGFNIGDKIAICPVDASSLKVGDKIAFVVYSKNYLQYHSLNKEEIEVSKDLNPKESVQFCHMMGFHTGEISEALRNGGMLTFHHITNVYKDENGKLWFKTQGSANADKDTWFVSEEMILGVYDQSSAGNFVLTIINFLNTDFGFIIFLLLPIMLILLLLLNSIIKDIHLTLLEMDVVEQKRKLTDDICVKYKIGLHMDTKTKYKILAQVPDEEKKIYLPLLWSDGAEDYAYNKYVTKHRMLSAPIRRLLAVNQVCELRYRSGEDIREIAKYYAEEKAQIKKEEAVLEDKLKTVHKMLRGKKKK